MSETTDSFVVGSTTCNFDVLDEGRSRRVAASVTVRHVPGGDTNVVNRGGKGVKQRGLSLYVPSEAEMDKLEDCCGSQGSLAYAEGSYAATLLDLDSTGWWPGSKQQVRSTWLIES